MNAMTCKRGETCDHPAVGTVEEPPIPSCPRCALLHGLKLTWWDHDRALRTDDGYTCDCGQPCPDLDAWHAHTAEVYNNPSPDAVRARGGSVHSQVVHVPSGTKLSIVECQRVACSNRGNGRGCFRVEGFEDPERSYPVHLCGFRSREDATELLERGGTISATYTLCVC